MRFHLTSLDRAKRAADKLTDLLDTIYDIEISRARARHLLARMLGYADWTELKTVTERHDQPPSPFDERLEPLETRRRLAGHAAVLVDELGLDEGLATEIVAKLRATASPAGPHRVFGPSSLPPPGALEYRGHGPDGPIVDGLPRVNRDFFLATQDIPTMIRNDDPEARSIIANTITKVFLRLDELDPTTKQETNPPLSPSDPAEKPEAITAEYLRGLGVGEGFVSWQDQYFRTKTSRLLDGADRTVPKLRINHFIPVPRREDDGSVALPPTQARLDHGESSAGPPDVMPAGVFLIAGEGEQQVRLMVGDPETNASEPLSHGPGRDKVRAITQSLAASLPLDAATLPGWLSKDPGFNHGLAFLRKLNGLSDSSRSRTTAPPATSSRLASCAFGDIEIHRDGHSVRLSARMKTGDEIMAFDVDIEGNRRFPHIETHGGLQLADHGFDETEPAGETAYEWSFMRVLRICGLYEPPGTNDPFGLARFARPGKEGLAEATAIWRSKISETGVDALRPLVDAVALDALRLGSEAPFRDERAYDHVRDIPRNAAAREVLLAYPMIFNEIWSSPELWDAPTSLRGLRRRLIEKGLSLKNTEYGDWLSLPPLPEWLVDWLSGRSYAPGPWAMHSYSRHFRDALVMLSVLGPEFTPATEADWHAMKMLVEAVDPVRNPIGGEWHAHVPAAFWRHMFGGAERGWLDYAEALVPSMRLSDAKAAVRQTYLEPALREVGIDPDHWYPVPHAPQPDEVLRPLLAAIGRRSMADCIAPSRRGLGL